MYSNCRRLDYLTCDLERRHSPTPQATWDPVLEEPETLSLLVHAKFAIDLEICFEDVGGETCPTSFDVMSGLHQPADIL